MTASIRNLFNRKRNKPVAAGPIKARKRPGRISRGALVGALGIALIGGASLKYAQRSAKVRQEIGLRKQAFENANIPNAESWATITPVYNLDPLKNKTHRSAVDSLNSIAGKTILPPYRVLLTLEQNRRDSYRIREIQNRLTKVKDPMERARLQKIIEVIEGFLKLDPAKRKEINDILETSGTLHELKKKRP